jgi:hypothetical protein
MEHLDEFIPGTRPGKEIQDWMMRDEPLRGGRLKMTGKLDDIVDSVGAERC